MDIMLGHSLLTMRYYQRFLVWSSSLKRWQGHSPPGWWPRQWSRARRRRWGRGTRRTGAQWSGWSGVSPRWSSWASWRRWSREHSRSGWTELPANNQRYTGLGLIKTLYSDLKAHHNPMVISKASIAFLKEKCKNSHPNPNSAEKNVTLKILHPRLN